MPLFTKNCFLDVLKLFFPIGWICFCIAGVIGYSLRSRWIAASAWFVSMLISMGFVVHICYYHLHSNGQPSNYRALPEKNQRNVSIKLIIALIVCITTLIMSIFFWISGEPETYADACGQYIFLYFIDYQYII